MHKIDMTVYFHVWDAPLEQYHMPKPSNNQQFQSTDGNLD